MGSRSIGKALVIAALVAGTLAAGCGDGGDGEGAAVEAPELTKQEWIEAADEICRRSDRELNERAGEFFESAAGVPEAEAEARFAEREVIPSVEQQVADVKALGAPEGDEERIAEIIAKAEVGLKDLRANPDPAAFEDPDHPLGQAGDLLGEYGSKVCGA